MHDSADAVTVAFRIPGQWSGPKELVERLPAGCRLAAEALVLPDGTEVEFGVLKADNQFAHIFRTSLRQPATSEELSIVDRYTANSCLMGPGGSLAAARRMMAAACAIVRAGGAGVFIDNCALAHGGQNWLALAEDAGPDAVSFAFAAIVRGKAEAYTMGMHVLGLPDLVMSRADARDNDMGLVEFIRYLARGEKPVGNGHIFADLDGPRFQAHAEPADPKQAGSPLHNPFGRLRLVNAKDMAERN